MIRLSLGLMIVAGCAGAPPATPVPPPIELTAPAPPPPEVPAKAFDADQRARALVDARLWAQLELSELRKHRAGNTLGDIMLGLRAFRVLRFDPVEQSVRAFVASPAAESRHFVMVFEHARGGEVAADIARAVDNGDAEPIALRSPGAFPAARVDWDMVIAAPTPTLFVLTSDARAEGIVAFAESAGIAPLSDGVSIRASAIAPAESMRGRRMPAVPGGVLHGHSTLRFGDDGGATVVFEGVCSDEEQALLAAREMNQLVDALGTVGLGPFRVNLARGFEFAAHGKEIRARRELSEVQVDTFVDLMFGLSRHERDPP